MMKGVHPIVPRGSLLISILLSSLMLISGTGTSSCSDVASEFGMIGPQSAREEVLSSGLDENFTAYMDYDEMTGHLRSLAKRYPNLMQLSSLGRSYEGRDIWCAKLSDSPSIDDDGVPGSEPDALLVGAHHGNEWISYEVPLYVISFLLENYGNLGRNGSAATYLLDNREIFIVPMLNTDGTQYSHDTGQGWRKNREPNYLSEFIPTDGSDVKLRPTSYGVDINRNYGWMWHLSGGSNALSQSGGSYRGGPDNHDDDGDTRLPVDWRTGRVSFGPEDGIDEDPWDGIDNDRDGEIDEDPAGGFSTAENVAMKELGEQRSFPVMITYHSFSELVLWPWGYTDQPTSDAGLFSTFGTRLAVMNGYTPMQGYDLYMTTGEMTDWFYASYGTLGFTYEIAKTYSPPEDQILQECERNLWSSLYLCHAAHNPSESYLDFRYNISSWTVKGGMAMVNMRMEDTGYPFDLDMERCVFVYRNGADSWRTIVAKRGDDGNWSASLPVDAYSNRLEVYLSLQDVEGHILTEPLYAPYEYIAISIGSGLKAYPGFTVGTFLIMFCTLGVIWGGFGTGIFRSITADRRRSRSIEL
jgi:hypothetical protein